MTARKQVWYKSVWFRAYIPILVTLISLSYPTVRDLILSVYHRVPFGRVGQSLEQIALWEKNRICISHHVTPRQVSRLPDGRKVSVLLCPSGDILVEIRYPGRSGRTVYRWMSPALLAKGSSPAPPTSPGRWMQK